MLPWWSQVKYCLIALLFLATNMACEIPTGAFESNSVQIPDVSAQCSVANPNCPNVGQGNSRTVIFIFTTVPDCIDSFSNSNEEVKARGTGTWSCGPGVCTTNSNVSFTPTTLSKRAYRVCAIVDLNENATADTGDRAGWTTVDYSESEPQPISVSVEWDNY
jgi:hypothetical protein